MTDTVRQFRIVGISLLLGGCVNAPSLNLNTPIEENNQGKVTRTIDHIACELAVIRSKHESFSQYAVAAQLTIKTENSGGVTPSLNLIKALAPAGSSRTLGIGGEFNRGRLKSFTQNFVFIVDGLKKDVTDCDAGKDPFLLTGNLGLEEVVVAGLTAIGADNTGVQWADGKKGETAEAAQFGSTIQFTTKLAGNGGLTLSKPKFKGFGGGNGLINASQTGTDVLVIAFAPIPKVEKPKSSPPKTQAPRPAKSLQDQLYSVKPDIDLSDLLKEKIAQPDNVVPPPVAPAPPPSVENEEETAVADATKARRAAVESAKRLLDSMILQNIDGFQP